MTDPNHITDTELRDELLLRRLRHWRGAMGDIQADAGAPQAERETRLDELLPAQTGDKRKEHHDTMPRMRRSKAVSPQEV